MLKNLKKMLSLSNIIIFIITCFVIVYLKNMYIEYNNSKEGFEELNNGPLKINTSIDTIYDPFYVKIYDELSGDYGKHEFEISHIINKTNLNSDSKVLDIGSGTGHTVNSLVKNECEAVGIDKSLHMCEKAKEIYPNNEFIVGDVMKSITFDFDEFSHITCLYFTIYYIKDKRLFFKNCFDWLKPGGFMVLHLVNKHMFDPVLPPGNPLESVNAQKYAKERITKTNIVFKNYNYESEFLSDDKNNGKTEFVEVFSNKKTKKPFRKNIHMLYMEDQSKILSIAKQMGFIVKSKHDMTPCSYEYNFLYVLKKPH
jgi:ubiquinone/menaquinone biosynthesis C-methylase UbiE